MARGQKKAPSKEEFLLERARGGLAHGQAAIGSKHAMVQAGFEEAFTKHVKPGCPAEPDIKAWIRELYKLSERDFKKMEREFLRSHPRYDAKSEVFKVGARRQVAEKPKKIVRRCLAANTLKVRKGTADKVGRLNRAAFDVVRDGLYRSDDRCGVQESMKFSLGGLMQLSSPNKKQKKAAFNGKAKQRRGNDTP